MNCPTPVPESVQLVEMGIVGCAIFSFIAIIFFILWRA